MPKKFRIGFEEPSAQDQKAITPPPVRRESKIWVAWLALPAVMLVASSLGNGIVSGQVGAFYGAAEDLSALEVGTPKSSVQARRAVLTSSGEDFVDASFCRSDEQSSATAESWQFLHPAQRVEVHFTSGELTSIEEIRPFGFF